MSVADLSTLRFAHPWVLAVGVVAVAFLLRALVGEHLTRRRWLGIGAPTRGLRPVLHQASLTRANMAAVSLLLASIILVGAVARPSVEATVRRPTAGLDVVVGIDTSKSMLVRDVEPSVRRAAPDLPDVGPGRLGRARELALHVLANLEGSRTAAMVFAGAAAHLPLTEDPTVSEQFLGSIGPTDVLAGSNLTEALRVGRCLLRPDVRSAGCEQLGGRGRGGDPLPGQPPRRPPSDIRNDTDRGKAIVLFTDGGDPNPDIQAEMAMSRRLGIAVILVGIGTAEGGEVFAIDDAGQPTVVKRGEDGRPVHSRRDDISLARLAALAGDPRRYVVASTTAVEPMPIVSLLREHERIQQGAASRHRTDVGVFLLWPAFLFLFLERVIARRRRRAPPIGRREP